MIQQHVQHEHASRSTAERFAALVRVGTALLSELDETRLLTLIAETACDLTGAAFAAFSIRPVNEEGQPLVPSEGSLFHLAAVVGVTPEQEALFRRMPLGGEGLLAPIFQHGVPILVADALTHLAPSEQQTRDARTAAREAAEAYAQGHLSADGLPSLGVPHGHPVVRSFLGAPVLDRAGQVRGGLLLGYPEHNKFSREDETLLVSLAGQAAVALENAHLYRMAQRRAQQLDAIFDSIADGVTLVDQQGTIVRENRAARHLRTALSEMADAEHLLDAFQQTPARHALTGEHEEHAMQVVTSGNGTRECLITADPLRPITAASGPLSHDPLGKSAGHVSGAVVVWHDITEHRVRESERTAKAQVKQLEAIFDAITDAIFVYDCEGYIIQTNTAARELIARVFSSDDVVGDSPHQRFTQLSMTDAQGQPFSFEHWPVTRLLAGEVVAPENAIDVTFQTIDGQMLHTSVTGGPLRDASGNLMGAVVIYRDETERKRAERELEQQAQQLRVQAHLIELAHDAILVRDPVSRVLSWNRGAEELYEWTPQEAHGHVSHTLLQTRFPVSREAVDRHLEQEGQWEGELTHTRRSGSQVDVESRQLLVRDEANQPTAILEINRDITERLHLEHLEREARAETEAQRALLQLILDELPSSVYLVRGKDARLILANRAATSVWGAQWPYNQPLQAFLAENHILLSSPTGRPLPPAELAMLRAVQDGETVRQHQEIIRHPDGSHLPVLVNAVALGTTSRLHRLPTAFSIEEVKRPEPMALVVHQDVAALKEAEYLKDEFIGIAAHELRNPVAALAGYASMLLVQTARGHGPALAEWQTEALQEIDQASARLVSLTE
jgi:PAS domain S-box-containing protein